ncbi:unnamed protein product [Oppiella nova]|uniref:Uncharacterized protein n=1 Tax=Oppiella nova TaxID=334625 RepID=A0A7R9QYU7_9ACAR|nr:unnamed protein product [Oppiella nova]CAG2179980.1 unnamed protein product [Oppiella nova]
MRDTSEAPAVEVVVQSGVDINAMKIYHKSVQPLGTNKCVHHLCPQLCLPSSYHERQYTCGCLPFHTWDGNTCVFTGVEETAISRACINKAPNYAWLSIDVQCFGKIEKRYTFERLK